MPILHDYLSHYSEKIQNSPIEVQLIPQNIDPYLMAVASARTCYSASGIIHPEDIRRNIKEKENAEKIARSTMEAGHLTTRQHVHFIFAISGLSRHVIWQMLHFHPFYNSEQVSQRYVRVKNNNRWYTLPISLEKTIANKIQEKAYDSYIQWIEKLYPAVEKEYFSIHKIKARNPSRYRKEIEKKAMEIARYILPISSHSYLYHTISNLMLIRYFYMFHQYPGDEFRILVLKMLIEIEKYFPDVIQEMPEPAKAKPEKDDKEIIELAKQKNHSFDDLLGQNASRLVEYPQNIDKTIQWIPGFDMENLDSTLDHSKNSFLMDVFYPVHLDPISSLLNQYSLTYQRKISHTGDSQAQRHRTLAATRPYLHRSISLEPDYIIPTLIAENASYRDEYIRYMDDTFLSLKKLYKEGASLRDLVYLLPNAYPIRYLESGSILHFLHKWKTRTCLNAQEEIFQSSISDLKELKDKLPQVYSSSGPPCVIRKEIRPRCPEGSRFCGVKVWEKDYLNLKRII